MAIQTDRFSVGGRVCRAPPPVMNVHVIARPPIAPPPIYHTVDIMSHDHATSEPHYHRNNNHCVRVPRRQCQKDTPTRRRGCFEGWFGRCSGLGFVGLMFVVVVFYVKYWRKWIMYQWFRFFELVYFHLKYGKNQWMNNITEIII